MPETETPPRLTAAASASSSLGAKTKAGYWLAVGLVIVVGVVLRLPVVDGTLISDDWDHYAMATGVYPARRSALDLFNFVGAGGDDRGALMKTGRLPWWTDPGIRISFLRPLSSVFTYADYAWFRTDRVPARGHWHSLLWWSAALVAAAGVLERLFSRPVALVALCLFAVDDAHGLPVAWSASRAEIIALAFMTAGWWAHIAWSEQPSRLARALAISLVWLGVFAGEHALPLFAYIAAYTCFARDDSWPVRLRALAPLALPLIVYLCLHTTLNYGVSGSSFYSDPFGDTERYLRHLPTRMMLLLSDALFGVTAEWWFAPPPWWDTWQAALPRLDRHALQLALGGLAAAMIAAGLFALHTPVLRRHAASGSLRTVVLGALGTLPALCGAFAMTRLTVAPALGLSAALSWLCVAACAQLRAASRPWRLAAAIGMAYGIVVLHGLVAATRSREASELYATWSRNEQAWVERAPLSGRPLPGLRIMIVSAIDIASQFSLPYIRFRYEGVIPASSQLLLPSAYAPIELERTGINALELSSVAGAHTGFRSSAYRLESQDFHVGQHFTAPNFQVKVLSVVDGVPNRLRFVFARALDDPGYLFLYPSVHGLQPLALPSIGRRMQLAAPATPRSAPAASGS